MSEVTGSVFDATSQADASVFASSDDINKEVAEKKEKKTNELFEKGKAMLKQSLENDKTLASKIASRKNDLEVTDVAVFSNEGGLVAVKDADGKNVRITNREGKETDQKAPSAMPVGYMVKNIGNAGIPYTKDVYKKNEQGIYVAETISAVLQPLDTVVLKKTDLTKLASRVEFSFQLSNGNIQKSSAKGANISDPEQLASLFYFSFDKNSGATINDEDRRVQVGEEKDGKWTVKKEYVDTFGYLNNPVVSTGKSGRRATGGSKLKSQDVYATIFRQVSGTM